jgi:hypothetical protein
VRETELAAVHDDPDPDRVALRKRDGLTSFIGRSAVSPGDERRI